jgi:hypothetical protein
MNINWVTVVVFVVGGAIGVVYGIEDLLRSLAFRRLAKEFGFPRLKKRLPEALSLYGTPFVHRRLTWNVIDGERHTLRVVVFDCQIGEGAGNWKRTVIAIRTGSSTMDANKFDARMKVENSGGWSVFYYPWALKLGLMPIKELRAHLASI